MPTGNDLVRYRSTEDVAEIELNRPKVLNALSDDTVLQLRAALDRADHDPEVRTVIIHGRGRAFSSGADVRQRQLRPAEEVERYGGLALPGTKPDDLMFGYAKWKPIICAVHGYAMGAALRIALLSEFVVAEAGTKFQVTETRRGLSGSAEWQEMTALGAPVFATDVCLTGRFFTAEEAFQQRLIHEVTPEGEYLDAARRLARALADNPPLAVQEMVRIRRVMMQRVEAENRALATPGLHVSGDFRERARAFIEKRLPAAHQGH